MHQEHRHEAARYRRDRTLTRVPATLLSLSPPTLREGRHGAELLQTFREAVVRALRSSVSRHAFTSTLRVHVFVRCGSVSAVPGRMRWSRRARTRSSVRGCPGRRRPSPHCRHCPGTSVAASARASCVCMCPWCVSYAALDQSRTLSTPNSSRIFCHDGADSRSRIDRFYGGVERSHSRFARTRQMCNTARHACCQK